MPAKKRTVPTYVGPKKAAPARKKRTAYDAPIKVLKAAITDHNKQWCIKKTGTKAALQKRLEKVDRNIVKVMGKAPKRKAKSFLAPRGGGTKGQKSAAKTISKLASVYGKLENDANPEYAFDTGQSKKMGKNKKAWYKK
jgi:hypothetical protein